MAENKKSKAQQVVDSKEFSDPNIVSDVNGSYTGVPLNGAHPIQDADDL